MNNALSSEFITYQPTTALIKSGTTGVYYNADGQPVTSLPVVTVVIDLTNFSPTIPNSGYIDYLVTKKYELSVRVTYTGTTKVLTILSIPMGVIVSLQGNYIQITDIDISQNFTTLIDISSNERFQVIIPATNLVLTPSITIPPTNNTEVRVPIINIYGQTTVNNDYLSDMTFVIQDKHKYKCHKNIIDCQMCGCVQHFLLYDQLKTTTFRKNNIHLEDVVKGKGKTLQDKVMHLFKTNLYGNDFQAFYKRFIQYAMLKYILIRLIYGEFDLNKMCRNFNKQFFKDLEHSRFCAFIEFFEDPINDILDFDQFYIKCNQSC